MCLESGLLGYNNYVAVLSKHISNEVYIYIYCPIYVHRFRCLTIFIILLSLRLKSLRIVGHEKLTAAATTCFRLIFRLFDDCL